MPIPHTVLTAAALLYGGVCDYCRRRIPDIVPALILLSGFLRDEPIRPRLLLMLTVFLALLATEKLTRIELPGGDCKLLCALAFTYGWPSLVMILFFAKLFICAYNQYKGLSSQRSIPLCSYVAPAFLLTYALQAIL